MRIVAVADLHRGATHLTTAEEQEQNLNDLLALVRERGADALLIAGDLFHHNRPSPQTITMVGRFFDNLPCEVIMAKGNHDPDAAEIARYYRGKVTVPSEPTILQRPGLDIVVMPYLPDQWIRARNNGALAREEVARVMTRHVSSILTGLRARARSRAPLVFLGHGTVAGSVTSTGWSFGFIAEQSWVLPVEELTPFDLAIVGHVHKHQAPAPNVVIPGALLPLDFSETEPKGAIVWELSEPVYEFVPLPTPRVLTLDIGPTSEEIEALVDVPTQAHNGEKVRVRLTCDEATAREYPQARIEAALRNAGASLVQVELKIVRPDRERAAVVAEAVGPNDALARYLLSRGDLGDAQRDRIVDRAQEVAAQLEGSQPLGGGDLDISRIEAENFLGISHAAIDFDGEGVVCLTGRNGAGKSTLGVDVLRYAAFGESRIGAKMADRLIRSGADSALAAVELCQNGNTYRIVRKTKRTARGPVSTLDVLESHIFWKDSENLGAPMWQPMSDGKVASGEKAIARILGNLDDATLCASSVVVQRAADAFTRARPEDRKRLLSQAAGLGVYDDLAEASRERMHKAALALNLLQARADPLRARSAAIPQVEVELAKAEEIARLATERVGELEREAARARAELERAKAEEAEWHRLQETLRLIEAETTEWKAKKRAADTVLASRGELVAARDALDGMRDAIVVLEGQLETETEAASECVRIAADKARAGDALESARHAELVLANSGCTCETCVFLETARELVEDLPLYEKRYSSIVLPVPPNPEVTRSALSTARARARDLEKKTAAAEKIARAEEVVVQYEEQVARLALRHDELQRRMPVNVFFIEIAARAYDLAQREFDAARLLMRTEAEHAAELRGRLETLREAAAELEQIEREITVSAADVAAWTELVGAWRAVRVQVLEAGVIPQVEDTANEILRRFPHGIQIALTTQREKRSGDGKAETLEIEVIGKGGLYEMCSGGERTTIDLAAHLALALIVSRRASTRLRFVVIDEPEGLDEQSRAAFAATVRYVSEQFSLRVLVMSHMDDIVDAVGGRRIEVRSGVDGSTVEVAA